MQQQVWTHRTGAQIVTLSSNIRRFKDTTGMGGIICVFITEIIGKGVRKCNNKGYGDAVFSLSVPTHCTKTTQVCILWKTKALYKQKQNIHIEALTLYSEREIWHQIPTKRLLRRMNFWVKGKAITTNGTQRLILHYPLSCIQILLGLLCA